jgi:mRNA interferase MazF
MFSDDLFNHGPAELVAVLPVTGKNREIPLRVPVDPPEGGLKITSYVMPELIRSISVRRLVRRLGTLGPAKMHQVDPHVRAVLGLG